jgi:hypothetical protein
MSLQGQKELDQVLQELYREANKSLVRPAIQKALRVLAKGIKSEVPPHYKEAKKLIGQRMQRAAERKKFGVGGKAGFGVGRRKKFKAIAKKDRSGRKGVGLAIENIHWYVLGTKERFIKKGGKNGFPRKGQSTGKMPPQLDTVVKDGVDKSIPAAIQKIKDELRAGFMKKRKVHRP